jgi:heterodisulfide reductase subunit A-like polyferredoxin
VDRVARGAHGARSAVVNLAANAAARAGGQHMTAGPRTAVVVGGGIAGLACALRLASHECRAAVAAAVEAAKTRSEQLGITSE